MYHRTLLGATPNELPTEVSATHGDGRAARARKHSQVLRRNHGCDVEWFGHRRAGTARPQQPAPWEDPMAKARGGSDAAAEQLYDELMARTWALHGVLQSVTTDVCAVRCVDTVGRRSAQLTSVTCEEASSTPVRSMRCCGLVGSCPGVGDAWWATPLGQLLSAGPASVGTNGRRSHCRPGRRPRCQLTGRA